MFLTILVAGLAEPSLADSVRSCSAAVHSAQLEDAIYACSRQAEEDTACGAALGLGRTAPFALPMLPPDKRAAALAYFDARVTACIEHEEGL
ncbi:hypothetical protein [Sphingomonas sp. ACRSK]|uniref:hypothetical protein n=1 Tax=Sphingomonas sp. ACRSK TaxID=2918213 RepID=UPI001EF4A3B2|nr:hypothetical protein [Sphingomonas sp. ACRSK]MCG7347050.1 hypothetical protein [Sphingomonas sp. ACRSK]